MPIMLVKITKYLNQILLLFFIPIAAFAKSGKLTLDHLVDGFSVHIFMICSVIALLVYYLIVWKRHGQNTQLSIFPNYAPPADINPGGLRYIVTMGYDAKVLAAAILNLAIKGFLKISINRGSLETQDYFTLIQSTKQLDGLSVSEKTIMNELFAKGDNVDIKPNRLVKQVEKYRKSLQEEFGNYFLFNRKFLTIGLYITAAAFFGLILLNHETNATMGCLFFACLVIGLVHWVSKQEYNDPKGAMGGLLLLWVLIVIFFGFVGRALPISYLLFFMSLSLLNMGFYYLLKRETSLGQPIAQAAKGFKMFLSAITETSTATFEKYLPYAIALDIPHQWGDRFVPQLEMTDYQPRWYSTNMTFDVKSLSMSLGDWLVAELDSASEERRNKSLLSR